MLSRGQFSGSAPTPLDARGCVGHAKMRACSTMRNSVVEFFLSTFRYTRARADGELMYLLYIRAIRDWAVIDAREWVRGTSFVAQSQSNDPSALCPDTATDWIGGGTSHGGTVAAVLSAATLVTAGRCDSPITSISDCAVARTCILDRFSPFLQLCTTTRHPPWTCIGC